MEEKNLASDMLDQMRKYVGGETNGEKPDDKYQPKSATKAPPKVRKIPKDESLFEFEFDDDEAAEEETVAPEAPAPAEEIVIPEPEIPAPAEEIVLPEPEIPAPAEEAVLPEPEIPAPAEEVVIPEPEEEPEQITFDTLAETFQRPDHTPEGEQISFLDDPEEDEEDEDVEEDQPTTEEPEAEPAPIEEPQITFSLDDPLLDLGEPEAEPEAAPEPEAEEQSAPLTAIERNALEEEERRRAEEDEAAVAKKEELATDIWDEADKKQWEHKKRYVEYCENLIVPPVKSSKQDTVPKRPTPYAYASSGYRYETVERAPIFTDGLGEGKNTDSYFKREREFCANREKERQIHFNNKLRVSKNKCIASLVIMLAVILIENIGVFFASGKPDALLTESGTVLFPIVIAVLLAAGTLLILSELKLGIRAAVMKGVFLPETLSAFVILPAVVYHIALAIGGGSSKNAMLFGTSAVITVFLTSLYTYFMIRRDQETFFVTSAYGDYVTDVKMSDFKKTPEAKAFGGYAEPDTALYKLNRVARIDGSYSDTPIRDECRGIIRKLFICIVCAALVTGIIFGILRRDVFTGMLSALSLISFASPVSVYVALFLPRIRAAVAANKKGGAIVYVDDENDTELEQSVIMIDGSDLYPLDGSHVTASQPEVAPDQHYRMELGLKRMNSLFTKVGGPLRAAVTEGAGCDTRFVVLTEISEHGLCAKVDGREIYVGNDVFMESLGVKFPRHDKLTAQNERVMYVVDEGRYFAKLVIKLKPDAELVARISELRNTDTLFSLKTSDPCIDRELLFFTTGLEPELLRLVKYAPADDPAPASTDREGSLVSKTGTVGLLAALLEYKRQKKLIFEAARFACVACGIGAAVSLVLSALTPAFGFTSLIAVALHGALSLIALLISERGAINTKSKIRK